MRINGKVPDNIVDIPELDGISLFVHTDSETMGIMSEFSLILKSMEGSGHVTRQPELRRQPAGHIAQDVRDLERNAEAERGVARVILPGAKLGAGKAPPGEERKADPTANQMLRSCHCLRTDAQLAPQAVFARSKISA